MSYFRSYFEKNNTIVKNSQINTAKNPTTEIFYGTGFSKFIFKIDFTDLINKVSGAELILNSDTKHTLHLTNTIFASESFLGGQTGTGKDRASSFDLILFKLNESWDEGVGYDYEETGFDYRSGNFSVVKKPSNWYFRNTLDKWVEPGIYTTGATILDTIHFDNGNEDINVDVTDYVNNILNGGEDFGIGLAFSYPYENINPDYDKSVAFFTKYTQTFFEPYVESFFNDRIVDNRQNFTVSAPQSLYLFVNKNGNPVNLYSLPSVDILDAKLAPIPSLTGLTTTQVKKGVYRVDFGVSGVDCSGKAFFYDVWKDLYTHYEVQIPDVKQKFIPKPLNSDYQIGENLKDFDRYVIQFYGVQQNEKIKRGDVRKIVVNFRSTNTPTPKIMDEAYYRMFIKEGNVDVLIHDWTLLDISNENFFTLNTSNYIPREYFVELKAHVNGDEIIYKDIIKFVVLSEK
jgi:hypothetical protein